MDKNKPEDKTIADFMRKKIEDVSHSKLMNLMPNEEVGDSSDEKDGNQETELEKELCNNLNTTTTSEKWYRKPVRFIKQLWNSTKAFGHRVRGISKIYRKFKLRKLTDS